MAGRRDVQVCRETAAGGGGGGEGEGKEESEHPVSASPRRERRAASAEKRRSAGPLGSSSSDDDVDDDDSCYDNISSPNYDSVGSPCNSTASEPIVYARLPGFELHGHAVTVSKSKKKKSEKNGGGAKGTRAGAAVSGSGAKSAPLDSVPESQRGVRPTPTPGQQISRTLISNELSGLGNSGYKLSYKPLPSGSSSSSATAAGDAPLTISASKLHLHARNSLKPPPNAQQASSLPADTGLCAQTTSYDDPPSVEDRLNSLETSSTCSATSTCTAGPAPDSDQECSDGGQILPTSSSSLSPPLARHGKKTHRLAELRDGAKQRDPAAHAHKLKLKREPLPMKLRALPQSFWQQPNVANSISPGSVYPVLPPLVMKPDTGETEVRPVTPPEERESGLKLSKRLEQKVFSTTPNTDLLFSLFNAIEGKDRKITVAKRGRPKKLPSQLSHPISREDDPLILDAIQMFPHLSVKRSATAGNQTLALVSIREGDKAVSLPQVQWEHNYLETLSDVVSRL